MMYKDVWLSPPMTADIAKLTRCTERTVSRWLKRGRIPETPLKLLQIIQSGKLGEIHDEWHGWKICSRTGQLWSPNGEKMHQGDISAIKYRLHQIRALRDELRKARDTIETLQQGENVCVIRRAKCDIKGAD